MIPACRSWIYLNTAAVGPCPTQVVLGEQRYYRERIMGNLHWDRWEEAALETKMLIGKLIHARAKDIALFSNTGEGLNTILNGMKWSSKDNVVTNDLEFSSNLFPWQWLSKRKGVELRFVKNTGQILDMSDYEEMIDDNTKIVAISHVEFLSGFKHDLKLLASIAHKHGAYLLVDGIQSAGAVCVNVRKDDVDFFACGGSKWLLGPLGTGFLYFKRKAMDAIEPTYVGWRNDHDWDDYSFREFRLRLDATRYEYGTPNFSGIYGLRESLKFILQVGMQRIEKRNMRLSEQLLSSLIEVGMRVVTPRDEKERGPIVTFRPKAPERLFLKLREKRISTSLRIGAIRFSPDFFNTSNEIEKAVDSIHRIVKSGS